jgi:hypothetical protein
VCWSCQSAHQLAGEAAHDNPNSSPASAAASDDGAARCPACASTRVIPRVHVIDQGQGSHGSLNVVVYGNPEALLFKDRLWGQLAADVCGDCGHVQFRVQNPRQLYEHYLRSKE